MAAHSEDSINKLQETVEGTIPPKKARVNDCEDGQQVSRTIVESSIKCSLYTQRYTFRKPGID